MDKFEIGEVSLTATISQVFRQFVGTVMPRDAPACYQIGKLPARRRRQLRGLAKGQNALGIQRKSEFTPQTLFHLAFGQAEAPGDRIRNLQVDAHDPIESLRGRTALCKARSAGRSLTHLLALVGQASEIGRPLAGALFHTSMGRAPRGRTAAEQRHTIIEPPSFPDQDLRPALGPILW